MLKQELTELSFPTNLKHKPVVGVNELKVIVKNDHTMTLNNTGASAVSGDKIYAATGPGWDDPQVGWHHCPAGMGIYQDVFVEVRERKWISDLFVRDGKELWIECFNADYDQKEVAFEVSLYGQNFEKTVFENKEFIPATVIHAGVGDTLTEAIYMAEDVLALILYGYETDGRAIPAPSDPGSFDLHEGDFVNYIACDTMEYRKMYNNKSIKKTLSIPEWLNEKATSMNLNFSQILQDGFNALRFVMAGNDNADCF